MERNIYIYIALLDIEGKTVQERLKRLAEDVLPESHCGFLKGGGCVDMIVTLYQLVEKFWEHTSKCYYTFIDLKKANDSVPREALWKMEVKLNGVHGIGVHLYYKYTV